MSEPDTPKKRGRPKIDAMPAIEMLANGWELRYVGEELGVDESTVRARLHRARKEWGARTTLQLIAKAVAAGKVTVN